MNNEYAYDHVGLVDYFSRGKFQPNKFHLGDPEVNCPPRPLHSNARVWPQTPEQNSSDAWRAWGWVDHDRSCKEAIEMLMISSGEEHAQIPVTSIPPHTLQWRQYQHKCQTAPGWRAAWCVCRAQHMPESQRPCCRWVYHDWVSKVTAGVSVAGVVSFTSWAARKQIYWLSRIQEWIRPTHRSIPPARVCGLCVYTQRECVCVCGCVKPHAQKCTGLFINDLDHTSLLISRWHFEICHAPTLIKNIYAFVFKMRQQCCALWILNSIGDAVKQACVRRHWGFFSNMEFFSIY